MVLDTVRFSFSTHSATSTALTEIVSFAIYAFPINYRQTVDISPTVFSTGNEFYCLDYD